MLNLPYYKDLRAVNLLNDDETQEIIKIVWATGYCGGGMRGARRGREGEGGRVGCGVRGARRLELCPRPQGVRAWRSTRRGDACGARRGTNEGLGVAALGRGESGCQESIGKS